MKTMLKNFKATIAALLALCTLGILMILDSAGVRYIVAPDVMTDLPSSVIAEKKLRQEAEKVCLIISDPNQPYVEKNTNHLQEVLELMRIGYQICDVSRESLPDPENYHTVLITLYDFEPIRDRVDDLITWVQNGGRAMILGSPENSESFVQIAPVLGIVDKEFDYRYIHGFTLADDFMIGTQNEFTFRWGIDGQDDMALEILKVNLNPSAKVYAWTDDAEKTPMIWTQEYGKGRFVVVNHDYFNKNSRGMTCAAYTLLEDSCIYPVINASTFFIDDFPSPIPFGTSEYIHRDYNTTIADFYTKIWWPDMVKLANKYDIKYTGLLIEDYSANVTGEFPRQVHTERFNHFGASLLNHGGEIGLHGYNHQPLVFTGHVFDQGIIYNTWFEESDIVHSFDEMLSFIEENYPGVTPSAYVPPSNILSAEGRSVLTRNYPQVKLISGLYNEDPFTYTQEFEIAKDGIIEFPRLTSGSVLDVYNYFDQLNGLNMYYVASHFIHPDDALDTLRGAELGWEQLYANTVKFFDWIYSSAGHIRSLTASDGGRAVARYDTLSVDRKENKASISLRFGGFWDEAYLMMRFNEGIPGTVEGGTVQHIGGDYYLLHATSAQVTINKA